MAKDCQRSLIEHLEGYIYHKMYGVQATGLTNTHTP